MFELTSFINLTFFVAMVCSLCYGLLLLLITIPSTEYTSRLRTSKNLISACFIACAVILWFTLRQESIADFPKFAATMMLVVTSVSAVALSYALINLLNESIYSRETFYLNMVLIVVTSTILARLMITGNGMATMIAIIIYIVLYVLQCALHTYFFLRVFRDSRRKLDNYYDEDEYHRLRWLRFCFWIMMATQVFVLVYFTMPKMVMGIYALWYCLFMLYFTSNYISFLSTHKLVLDAFAHKALDVESSGKRKPKKAEVAREQALSQEGEAREKEFQSLEKNLEKWVADKKYREFDKSREDIADELKTSKELLQLYFVLRKGVDFRTWRTELRVEDAKAMLLEDKKASIQIVSELSGFSDRSNFHRQFTKIVGVSPKEWRETDGHPEKRQ